MKKALAIFLGIFSLLIINKIYYLGKQDSDSFSTIENGVSEEMELVENGIKLQYFTNLSQNEEKQRIENCIINKYGVDELDKGNNIKDKIKNINIDISIYSIDNRTKVEIVLINNSASEKTDTLLDVAKEIRNDEYTETRIFQFVKYRTKNDSESIPKSIIENSKQDTIRSLEINNGKVSNIVMNDDRSINVAQVNYNSGSYLIIGTPTIFITY
ncbi:MAG: hypothetical protein MJ191_04720 [Clostridium sp.]|nr:hypothetical protein [Clostridium sp.]